MEELPTDRTAIMMTTLKTDGRLEMPAFSQPTANKQQFPRTPSARLSPGSASDIKNGRVAKNKQDEWDQNCQYCFSAVPASEAKIRRTNNMPRLQCFAQGELVKRCCRWCSGSATLQSAGAAAIQI